MIVTIDAMGTHSNIAQAIRDKEADYVLADQVRARVKNAGTNLAIIRRFVLNLFRLNKTPKQGGLYNRRILAASSDRYRAQLLGINGIDAIALQGHPGDRVGHSGAVLRV